MISTSLMGALNQLECVVLASGSITDIVVATDDTKTVVSIALSNSTASPILTKIYWNNGSTDFLIWAGSVAAGLTTNVTEPAVPLRNGQKLRVQGAANLTVAALTTMETPTRMRG
jgi:hypothetical protein